MLASYGHLLSQDESCAEEARNFSGRICDLSQQLETVEISIGAAATTQRTTYDASCHLLYGQHAGDAPLKMLMSVPGLDFARLEGSENCCGGAGIYNLLEPELSRRVLEEGGYEGGGAMIYYGKPGPFAPEVEELIHGKVRELMGGTS